MARKIGIAPILYDDTTGAIVGILQNGVEYLFPVYKADIAGTVSAVPGPVTSLLSSQIAALTTVGAASLSSAQVQGLTTTQLTALCANNDQIISALKKLGSAS